jgi:hypothetical protein
MVCPAERVLGQAGDFSFRGFGEAELALNRKLSLPVSMTKTMPLTIRRSSTRGMPCDSGKYGSIRRICASLNNQSSDTRSISSVPPLNQPIGVSASD